MAASQVTSTPGQAHSCRASPLAYLPLTHPCTLAHVHAPPHSYPRPCSAHILHTPYPAHTHMPAHVHTRTISYAPCPDPPCIPLDTTPCPPQVHPFHALPQNGPTCQACPIHAPTYICAHPHPMPCPSYNLPPRLELQYSPPSALFTIVWGFLTTWGP